jgi:acetylornithine/succinyldiaminopimelate/putrescine aminotransferase/predicted amino acid dehydrogenase
LAKATQDKRIAAGIPMTDSLYGQYCKPKLQELLHALKLDEEYVQANGDYLTTGDGRQVLDFVGGFGATILGHNHPRLKAVIADSLENNLAIHTQGAVRQDAAKLAERLSQLASDRCRYLVNFSNSGTEAVEAALKHAYKNHFDHVRREYERISRALEDFYVRLQNSDKDVTVPNGKSLNKFRDDLDEHNLGQFESFQNNPQVIAFDESYHGKSTSALKMTFNKSYREAFEGLSAIRPHFINPDNPERIAEIAEEQVCVFYYPVVNQTAIEIRTYRVTAVMAVILEVLRGEGGIRPLPEKTLQYLVEHYKRLKLPLIVDEIQTGCGRLGSVFSYHRTPLAGIDPDYITLSKALGGGLSKIGATLIRADIYDQDFGILHTSTFGEDALSARVANQFLDILSADSFALCQQVLNKGEYLRKHLNDVKQDFPELILDIRGDGLMFGIEFSDLKSCSPFFRSTGKQGALSLLISSYLLTYHSIRVFSPLTTMLKGSPGKKRQSIIRIQPSAYIKEEEIDRLITALREVLEIIRANNEYALIYHLIGEPVPHRERATCREIPVKWPIMQTDKSIDARTGFIAHPTGIENLIEYYFPSFENYPHDKDATVAWWNRIARFLEPVHCRSDYIRSRGFVLENNIVFVPYLPGYLNQEGKPRYIEQEIRDKVQDAVTIAKELGDDNIPVTMVGLGAYTSIVTQNATAINDYEVPVTTGNAYTAALTVQGIFREAELQGLELNQARIAVIGANGNIGNVLARILSLYAGQLVLMGSASSTSLPRLKATRQACYAEVLGAAASGNRDMVDGLGEDLLRWIDEQAPTTSGLLQTGDPDARDRPDLPGLAKELDDLIGTPAGPAGAITVSVNEKELHDCDVIVIATNSENPDLVTPQMVKPGAIVCCASMPSNISPQFDDQSNQYCAFDGGLAHLPEDSEIDFVGMPGNQLAYGCLSETLLLGFDGQNHSFSKGQFDPDQVYKTIELADSYGFALGELMLHNKPVGGHRGEETARDV